MTPVGLPHSDTAGSMGVSPSPTLFAGNRVLLRLTVARHPPYALGYLFLYHCFHNARTLGSSLRSAFLLLAFLLVCSLTTLLICESLAFTQFPQVTTAPLGFSRVH